MSTAKLCEILQKNKSQIALSSFWSDGRMGDHGWTFGYGHEKIYGHYTGNRSEKVRLQYGGQKMFWAEGKYVL